LLALPLELVRVAKRLKRSLEVTLFRFEPFAPDASSASI